jgi:hypothetical protein
MKCTLYLHKLWQRKVHGLSLDEVFHIWGQMMIRYYGILNSEWKNLGVREGGLKALYMSVREAED